MFRVENFIKQRGRIRDSSTNLHCRGTTNLTYLFVLYAMDVFKVDNI
jgi:hypothetical protein